MVLSACSTLGLMILFNFKLIAEKWDALSQNYPVLQFLNGVALIGMIAGYYGASLLKYILKNGKEMIVKGGKK